MNMPKAPPRKKMLLNDWRQPHPTSTEPLGGGKYPAQLFWGITNAGKIVLTVNDGVYKEGAKNTHKEIELDYMTRGFIFEALLEAASDPTFTLRQIPVQKKDWVNVGGQRRLSEQPIIKVSLTITKEPNGVITLGWSKGDYKGTFVFKGPGDTVIKMKSETGEVVLDHGMMSRFTVRAYVHFHRTVLDEMERAAWAPPPPKPDQQTNSRQPASNNSFDEDDTDF